MHLKDVKTIVGHTYDWRVFGFVNNETGRMTVFGTDLMRYNAEQVYARSMHVPTETTPDPE